MFRTRIAGCLRSCPIVLAACLLAQASVSLALRAEAPKAALTPEQQEKLKERDRFEARTRALQQEGKLVEAIAAAEKMLVIEQQVFGNMHEEVAGSLEWLAGMHQQRDDFAAARKARQEVLTIRVKLHGAEHWKVTDARLALADVEGLGRMTASQRQRLAEAERLNAEVVALYHQGRFPEAVHGLVRLSSSASRRWATSTPPTPPA